MKIHANAALAAFFLVAGASAAQAGEPSPFSACDGYGTPTGNGDGMTKEARGLFGLLGPNGSAGNTRRTIPFVGAEGLAACDRALADPRLRPDQWQRRVSLLQARAIHELMENKNSEALADLDKAEAAARNPSDPFYQRSLGLGLRMVRAYVLRQLGRKAEAETLAGAVLAERPYNRQIALAFSGFVPDPTARLDGVPALQPLARLDPRAIDLLFLRAFNGRDFAAAIALHPHISLPVRTPDKGYGHAEQLQEMQNLALNYYYTAERRARLAYALAATGQAGQARHEIQAAKDFLAANVPMSTTPGVEESKEQRTWLDLVANAVSKARPVIDDWGKLIEWRLTAEEPGGAQKVKAALSSLSLPPTGAQLDLLLTMKRQLGADPGLDHAIASLQARLTTAPVNLEEQLTLLFKGLPHAEIQQRIAAYRKANSEFVGYLWGGVSGFKTHDEPSGEVVVEFTGEKSSASVVEEMALLRAADLARERGKTGLVITARRDYERTENTVYYRTVLRSDPIGYSTELTVELVDAANPPAIYRTAPWRVIPVQPVLDALGPVYSVPQPQGPGGNKKG